MIKVSVVVPVYNVEKYLDRCINSLLEQTINDIEIILVDDGSPDHCPDMCDEYEKKHANVHVIHKPNGGLSSARNAGIDAARGEYIGFVDSDDDVEIDMYERLYNAAAEHNSDYVMCDYSRIFADKSQKSVTKAINGGYYSKDRMRKEIYPSLIMGENIDYGPCLSVCLAVFKRSFLLKNGIRFDEDIKWSEDNIFSAMVGYQCESMFYMKHAFLYHYRENPGTITTSYRKGAWEVYCKMNRHLREYFKDKPDIDWQKQLKLHTIYYALCCLRQERSRSKHLTQEYKHIIESDELAEAFRDLNITKVPLKLRIILELIKRKSYTLLGLL